MKKYNTTTLRSLIFMAIALFLVACEKKEEQPIPNNDPTEPTMVDYRDKWCGVFEDDVIQLRHVISKSSDSAIVITHLLIVQTQTMNVTTDGDFEYSENNSTPSLKAYGTCYKDSLVYHVWDDTYSRYIKHSCRRIPSHLQ